VTALRQPFDKRSGRDRLFLACECGELHPSSLVERDIGYVCLNCEARKEGKPSISVSFVEINNPV
jgi:hypothetical protein